MYQLDDFGQASYSSVWRGRLRLHQGYGIWSLCWLSIWEVEVEAHVPLSLISLV